MTDDQLNPDLLEFANDFENDIDEGADVYSLDDGDEDGVIMDSYDDMDMF